MEAYIPCGTPIKSSRQFLSGGTAISQNRRSVKARGDSETREISPIKLPFLPKPGSKSKSNKATPEEPVVLSAAGVSTTSQPPSSKKSKSAVINTGLPKFYNATTARHQYSSSAAGQCGTPFDVRYGLQGAKPVNARDNDQGGFRNMDLYTDPLVWARPGWSSDEARVGIRVALRNVFGNANFFESETAELAYSISCVTKTGDMREFVRALGLSEAYKKRFFEPCSNMRFAELNFKHFLGRAPHNRAEVSAQIRTLTEEGYNAAINAIIDSEEYDRLFGQSRLPAVNFRGGHPYNNDMNKTALLNGPYTASDRVIKKAILPTGDETGFAAFSLLKGLPEAWRGENAARNATGPLMEFPSTVFWNLPPPGLQQAELAWTMRYGKSVKFWYKSSLPYKQVMQSVVTHSDQENADAAAVLKYGSLMADKYTATTKVFDKAPVITIQPPMVGQLAGKVGVQMQTIETAIPPNLLQEV